MIARKWTLFKQGKLDPSELPGLIFDIGHDEQLLNELSVQQDLIDLLSHADPLVRHNALGALAYHGLDPDWDSLLGRRLLSYIEQMLLSDEDQDCRRQAAGAMGSLFKCTNNRKALARLAAVCLNKEEYDDVRLFAYKSILHIMCVPLTDHPRIRDARLSQDQLSQIEDLLE